MVLSSTEMVNAQEIKNYVEEKFPQFGVNKRQEVTRLLFEIAKREKRSFREIFAQYPSKNARFDQFKDYLIERRFPELFKGLNGKKNGFKMALPELDINPECQLQIQKREITLKNIFIEESVVETNLVRRLKSKFPNVHFEVISGYKEHTGQRHAQISDYNNRLESFYIVRENFDFFKPCPCSFKSVSCGYHVINLGSGCGFECTYCYLQDYLNSKGIALPANIEDFFVQFENYASLRSASRSIPSYARDKQDIRLGAGELTDSLIFDHITGYSPIIVDFFKKYPKSTFEFKTKSNNIALLLTAQPAGNIVVSWSMNPQAVIDTVEFYTASLEERLKAAEECVRAGYKVAFHFDPIIYYEGWERGYEDLVNLIFDRIPEKSLDCFSLGTLRMTPRLKKIIENRFPENTILDGELVLGYDDKLRYPQKIRTQIYEKMISWIRRRSPSIYFYLCMEEKAVCGDCQAPPLKNINQPKQL